MTPALLTSTSTRPNFSIAKRTNPCTSARSVTSSALATADCPLAVSFLPIVSSRSTRRAPSTTVAPRSASRRALASPMPLLAPVISTTFPLMFDMVRSFSSGHRGSNLHAVSAVGHDDGANQEARLLGRQECRNLRDLFRLGGAPDRCILSVFGQERPPIGHEMVQ